MTKSIEIDASKGKESFEANIARPADAPRDNDFGYCRDTQLADGPTTTFFAEHLA